MSAAHTYKIVVNGNVSPGQDLKQVQDAFCDLFRLEPKQVKDYFRGKPMVIREDLNAARAKVYLAALKKIGMESKLLRQGPSVQGGKVSCPKCGMSQAPAEECVKCGVVMEKCRDVQERIEAGEKAREAADGKKPLAGLSASGFARPHALGALAAVVMAGGVVWQLLA